MKRETLDLAIVGSMGFFQISACSAKRQRFMRRVQGNDHGTAFCDDTQLTQNIADGAVTKGLKVDVNGEPYSVRS